MEGTQKVEKREIAAGSNKKTPNAVIHLQSLGQFPLLAKQDLKHRIIPSKSLFLITASQCSVRSLNLAMSWVMSLSLPLLCLCERQSLVFISSNRKATQEPELLSALPKVTQLVTRKIEIKPRFPDCQTQIPSSHPCSFLKTIWLCIPLLCYLPNRGKKCVLSIQRLVQTVIATSLYIAQNGNAPDIHQDVTG